MTDQQDPLAGHDPYPREQIDVLGLHRERAELLENIVSTPGPGATAPSTRTKVLMSLGIAAALAIVGGGVWFATGGDARDADDPVAAASPASEPDEASERVVDETSQDVPEEPSPSATGRDDVRADGLRVGEVLSARECRELATGKGSRLPRSTTLLRLRRDRTRRPLDAHLYAVSESGRVVVIDGKCRVLEVGKKVGEKGADGETRLRLRPRPSDRPR